MRNTVREALKAVVQRVLCDYSIYFIYECPMPPPVTPGVPGALRIAGIDDEVLKSLREHPYQKIAGAAAYSGVGATGWVALDGTEIAATCWAWNRERLGDSLFFTLTGLQYALVDVVTAPDYRGRGLAPAMISFSARTLVELGMTRYRAWIWWTNTASIRAFEKVGWRRSQLIVTFRPFGRRKRWVIKLNTRFWSRNGGRDRD